MDRFGRTARSRLVVKTGRPTALQGRSIGPRDLSAAAARTAATRESVQTTDTEKRGRRGIFLTDHRFSHYTVILRCATATPVDEIDTYLQGRIGNRMQLKLCQFQKAALKRVLARRADRDLVHVVALPTGAGKTRVGLAAALKILDEGGNVLWVAKSWQLLRQALNELREACPARVGECRRIGGCSADLEIPTGNDGRIFFTTLQTFARRRSTEVPKRVRPSTELLVVWDEAHWAQDAMTGRKVKSRYLGKAWVVGLTATPRESAFGTTDVAFSVPYAELSKAGRLAEPRVRSISTGIDWSPTLAREGEFAGPSLRELGRSEPRNRIIIPSAALSAIPARESIPNAPSSRPMLRRRASRKVRKPLNGREKQQIYRSLGHDTNAVQNARRNCKSAK